MSQGIATSLYNCGFNAGALMAAWVTYGTRNDPSSWSWRVPSVLQVALPIVALPGILLCIESPRYLISVGRVDQAHRALAKAHAGGDSSNPVVALEATEIATTLAADQQAEKTASYASLVKGKGNRHRLAISMTLGFFAQWTGNGVVSYTLFLVSSFIRPKRERILTQYFRRSRITSPSSCRPSASPQSPTSP